MGKVAAIIGATGATGKEVLKDLLSSNEIDKVIVFVRRPLAPMDGNVEEHILNFDEIESVELEDKIDVAYCCLGTTIKKAKSVENFRKVDVNYPISFAKLCKKYSCQNFNVISAVSSDSNSRHYYSRAKGDMELSMIDLDFQTLNIYRPGLLVGKRDEFRFLEGISGPVFKVLDCLMVGKLRKYESISINFLANAIVKRSLIRNIGVHTLYKPDLEALGQ